MEERGTVTRISGDTAEITIKPSEACAKCPACEVCRPSGNARIIEVSNRNKLEVGDEVTIQTVVQQSLFAVFSFFGLPVLLSFIGLLIGQHYSEIGSLIIGTGGFILGLAIAKIINNVVSKKRGFHPRIVKIDRKTD